MSSGTDRAREKLQVLLDIGSDQEFGAYCDLLALAIKQHEALREAHGSSMLGAAHGWAVKERNYTEWFSICPECAVLLQWEQMWEEKKTG